MAENHKMPLIHTNPTKNSALRSGSASQHYRYTIDLQNLPEIVFSKDHVKHSRPSEYTIIEKTLYQKNPKNTLVGGLEHFLFFHILGMSSSQLTFTPSFFRRVGLNHQPVTRLGGSSFKHLPKHYPKYSISI